MGQKQAKRSYQFKLKPNKEKQKPLFQLLISACRLYNDALKERKDASSSFPTEEGFLLEASMEDMSSLWSHVR